MPHTLFPFNVPDSADRLAQAASPIAHPAPEAARPAGPPANPREDPQLAEYGVFFEQRIGLYRREVERIRSMYGSLAAYADLHLNLGMHKYSGQDGRMWWLLREWLPAATEVWLTTDYLNFGYDPRFAFKRTTSGGIWTLQVPAEDLPHGTYLELRLRSPHTGTGEPAKRVPAFAVWVEQDHQVEEQWCARVWDPAEPYQFQHDGQRKPLDFPRIYEAHVGIAQPALTHMNDSVGTYTRFTQELLPRIKEAGYTAVQLMGIPEHPLYKSFGYQVTSYFAPSSRFGTPDEFKELVDTAHSLGLAVILDIPHSHSAPNAEQGLAQYDTTRYFFEEKDNQWGTLSFDYGKEMTRRFLMSNCRYWLEEYHVDGFRFDAVGNMVYIDHGFGDDFCESSRCFYTLGGEKRLNESGVLYLSLVNALIHELSPNAVSIAEEFSGFPGLTSAPLEGGLGFDYRFAMGLPDFWGKFIKENRTMGLMWYEMTNYRPYDRTISYVACHDQCINGKDAMIWRLIGDEMYTSMSCFQSTWKATRGVALYKLMRLITLGTADKGFLNFMGDEFGHPEWIDAEGYGHRQWHLTEDPDVKYAGLAALDRAFMRDLVAAHLADFHCRPVFNYIHEDDRVLAFERGELLFVLNFHEIQPQTALKLWVRPGKYVEYISTDSPAYAGHGNLVITDPPTEHFTEVVGGSYDRQLITLYLPPMVGLILVRQP